MKKLHVISLMIAACLPSRRSRIAGNARTADADIPAPPAIGATIVDFTLPDADGKNHSLASLKGKNGTVLIFVATAVSGFQRLQRAHGKTRAGLQSPRHQRRRH